MLLKQYDYFGERALLNDAPRAATVRSKGTMKLLQISKSHFEEVLGKLDELIDSHRRGREESARRVYLQQQAEGLLDCSASDFTAVSKIASWSCSDLYIVKRADQLLEKDEAVTKAKSASERLTIRLISKAKATDEGLRDRVMQEIKLLSGWSWCREANTLDAHSRLTRTSVEPQPTAPPPTVFASRRLDDAVAVCSIAAIDLLGSIQVVRRHGLQSCV